MELSFHLMLWRASLAHAPVVPSGRDLIEWAELLRDNDETLAAELLSDVAAIGRGYPQVHFDKCDSIERAQGAARQSASKSAIELAIVELEDMATAFSPSLIPRSKPDVSEQPWIERSAARQSTPGDIAQDGRRLLAILADPRPLTEAAAAEVQQLIGVFVEAHRRLPGFDYRALRDGPLDRLAAAIALAALIDFALGMQDLALAPSGSIALLHHAVWLGRDGLGPYLSGVGRLVRESRDLFELAGRVAVPGTDAHEAWIFLLVRGCDGALLLEIIDDLGDRGRSHLLSALLARALSRTAADVDQQIVARIRDAAIDNADWNLAAAAQSAIASLCPTIASEQELLGRILATSGDFVGAEAVYAELAKQQPENVEWRTALLGLHRNDVSGLTVARGLTSPAARQELRLRRRGVAPAYCPRWGERISAVDVA